MTTLVGTSLPRRRRGAARNRRHRAEEPRYAIVAVAVLLWIAILGSGQPVFAASLSVEVVNELGQPIESAAVILRPELQQPVEVPPPFFTDIGGRVVIDGLADGEWQVEVRSEGYMIFSAYLKLISGLPPVVGFTSKQRTGTFWAPLDVVFHPVGISAEAMASGKKLLARNERKQLKRVEAEHRTRRKRAEKEEREAEKRARAEEKRRDQRARRTELAVITEPSPAEPEVETPVQVAESRPVAANSLGPAERDVERPSAAPARPAAAPVEVTPVEVTPVEATPATATSAEVTPAEEADSEEAPEADRPPPPAPRARPRQVPTIRSRPVLLHGGACPECKTGEWALIVERQATPRVGNETDCGSGRAEAVEQVLDRVLVPRQGALAGFAGPLLDSYGSGVAAKLGSAIDDSAYRSLTREQGACQSVVAILPLGARFVGFRFEAADANGSGDCFGTNECSVGEARWVANPEIARRPSMTVIHTSFLNESPSLVRRGRLIVLFVPARGWTAP